MAKCLYSGCSSRDILSSESHVDVKTVLPAASEVKKLKSKLQIKWKTNGEAVFHRACWDVLLKSARSRNYLSDLPKLIEGEKILITEAAKTAEFFDSFDSMKESAEKCAGLIKASKHCTAFTGAGISTSAGIGDFRGKSGKWTQQAHSAMNMDKVFGEAMSGQDNLDEATPSKDLKQSDSDDAEEETKKKSGVSYKALRPTYTHEALQKLIDAGYLKYIISQNCDGLHALSGVPHEKLSELHGNVFVELCEKCGTHYGRPSHVKDGRVNLYYKQMSKFGKSSISKPPYAKKCETCRLNHRTGRLCEKKDCNGYLIDSIINFGDSLEEDVLNRAVVNAKQSDLMLCLGSTLTVSPANSLVEMTKEDNLAICNRQKTHMDHDYGRGVRVFGNCDVFMREVMRGVLEPDELKEWEDGREKRMKRYNTLRVAAQ